MSSAFGDAEFRILWDGNEASFPGWERESYSSSQHIPGSSRTDTFLLGFGPYVRSFTVLCDTQSHYRNLVAMQQTEATLRVPAAMNDLDDAEEIVLFGNVFAEIPDVLLVGITAPQKWVDGSVSCLASFQWEGPEEAE
jgi:hypothetical protein